ncbi:MAG: zinc ribbon domain-containing protein [Sedimenticola sp.]
MKKVKPKHLDRRANRDLLYWRHYAFRQRLIHRAAESDCQVIIQDERFTSMTCGKCGTRNTTLASSETFMCKVCDYGTHHDINGARNILLKALGCFPFT